MEVAAGPLLALSPGAISQQIPNCPFVEDVTSPDLGFGAPDPALCLGVAQELQRRLDRLQVPRSEEYDVVPTVLRDPDTLIERLGRHREHPRRGREPEHPRGPDQRDAEDPPSCCWSRLRISPPPTSMTAAPGITTSS